MLSNIPPVTRFILFTNLLLFFATYVFQIKGIASLDILLGAFFPASVNFKPYQIITHMFMHGGIPHLVFNMYALFSFGSVVEKQLKTKRYLILFFAAGLGSYALHNIVQYYDSQNLETLLRSWNIDTYSVNQFSKMNPFLNTSNTSQFSFNLAQWQNYLLEQGVDKNYVNTKAVIDFFASRASIMLGASGAIYGVLVAFAMLYPDSKLSIIFLPFLSLKAKYFVPLLILVDLYFGLEQPSWDPVARFAHLGGALIGYILMFYWKKSFYRWN